MTLGQAIRAARLGYVWCAKVQAMMRISGDGPFLVELAPADQLPDNRGNRKRFHRVWWEGNKKQEIIDGIKPLARIKAVKRPVQFTVGDDGDLIGGVK